MRARAAWAGRGGKLTFWTPPLLDYRLQFLERIMILCTVYVILVYRWKLRVHLHERHVGWFTGCILDMCVQKLTHVMLSCWKPALQEGNIFAGCEKIYLSIWVTLRYFVNLHKEFSIRLISYFGGSIWWNPGEDLQSTLWLTDMLVVYWSVGLSGIDNEML